MSRPPLDPRVRAEIGRLHSADPTLSVRAIAAKVGTSRESVRRTLRAADEAAAGADRGPWAADRRWPDPGVPAGGFDAAAGRAGPPAVWPPTRDPVPMDEADHAAFDRGGPARVWRWPV